jgi:hypothetical protein
MKKSILTGLICALVYGVFVFSVPHDVPRNQGMETDLLMNYVNGAYALDQFVKHQNFNPLWLDLKPMDVQGAGYPLVLWLLGGLFNGERGWNYWQAAKIIGILSAMAVIFLCNLWLGGIAGIVASLALAVNATFFEMTYGACTDIFVLALGFWAAYALYRGRYLAAGILVGWVCITRYEFLIFMPFAIWYMFHVKRVDLRWGQLCRFIAPTALCLILNFQFASFPPNGGHYNIALHYLNTKPSPDQMARSVLDEYPNMLSVVLANPMNTARIFIADLWNLIAKFAEGLVLAPLLIYALYGMGKMPKLLVFAVATHFLILAFTVYHWETARYFLPEILFLTTLGAFALVNFTVFIRRRWLILLLLPFVILNLNNLSANVQARISQSADLFKDFVIPVQSSVLSLRPTAAFMNGWNWRYWSEGINLYPYCLKEKIDYVYWGGMEYYNRDEYRNKFETNRSAEPEFILHQFNKAGGLFYVNKADSIGAGVGDRN